MSLDMRSAFQSLNLECKNRTLPIYTSSLTSHSDAGQLTATANEVIVVRGWLWYGVAPPRSGPLA